MPIKMSVVKTRRPVLVKKKPGRQFISVSLVTVGVLFSVIGSGASLARKPPEPSPFPLTIRGDDGKALTLKDPPKRIVAIDSGAVEILFAIGEGTRVIGTHQFESYPAETEKIEKVGNSFNLNFEKISQLQPDLMVIFFDRFVPALRRLGIPVLYLKSPSTFKQLSERMRLWGDIVDKREAADKLAMRFEQKLEAVGRKIMLVKKGPRVFHDVAPGLWTLGSGTLTDEIYTFLKAVNIFADLPESQQVSPEAIVMRDPQVIISVYATGPEMFRTRQAFRKLTAVRDNRLFVVEADLISVPGPRLIQGIEQLARVLYPTVEN